jgi:SpoVK/Ycf46/Vps4 family AAA+-type ATPase
MFYRESIIINGVLNRSLQSSILRRFEKRIFIDLPNANERKEIIEKLLPVSGYQHLEFAVDYGEISQVSS